jgi:general stress protein 26
MGKIIPSFGRLMWFSITTLLLASFALEGSSVAQASRRDMQILADASVIYIATVRKDGNQSTAAPVWFTVRSDRDILIQTAPTTWKAKRIRRGSPVIVWIGKRDGPAFIGKAQITDNPTAIKQIAEDYPKKYLLARLGLHRPTTESFAKGERLAIEITPVRDLPEGFTSQPGTPAPALEGQHH